MAFNKSRCLCEHAIKFQRTIQNTVSNGRVLNAIVTDRAGLLAHNIDKIQKQSKAIRYASGRSILNAHPWAIIYASITTIVPTHSIFEYNDIAGFSDHTYTDVIYMVNNSITNLANKPVCLFVNMFSMAKINHRSCFIKTHRVIASIEHHSVEESTIHRAYHQHSQAQMDKNQIRQRRSPRRVLGRSRFRTSRLLTREPLRTTLKRDSA